MTRRFKTLTTINCNNGSFRSQGPVRDVRSIPDANEYSSEEMSVEKRFAVQDAAVADAHATEPPKVEQGLKAL